MKINSTRMAGNLYNKVDAEKWMIVPKLSEIPRTSFFDVNNLVLFDEDIFNSVDTDIDEIDLSKMYEEL